MKGIIEIIYILIKSGERKILWGIILNLFFIIFTGLLEMISSYSLVSLGQYISSSSLPNLIPILNLIVDKPISNLLLVITLSSTFSALFKVYLIELQYQLSGDIGARLSYLLTNSLLNKNWEINQKISDKSEYITTCVTHIPNLVGVTNHFITLISSAIFVLGLVSGLIISSPKITIAMMFLIGFFYLISLITVRKPLIYTSKIISNLLRLVQQIHSEIYDLRKEINISKKNNEWSESVYERYYYLALAQKKSGLLSESPRIIIEMLVILSICIIIIFNTNNNFIIDTLAIIFILIQKVMPNIQKIFSSISIGMAYKGGIDSVIRALKNIFRKSNLQIKSNLKNKKVKCQTLKIEFFPRKNHLNIKGSILLERGTITCLIGKSGSGKTTIINNIIENSKLNNIVFKDQEDGTEISPQKIIDLTTLVSQSPKLITGSLTDNILLNPPLKSKTKRNKLDNTILKNCLIFDLKKQLDSTTISSETSERGLSGGQIQRIAIARALHHNSEILLLDEPTSALDDKSSLQIIQNLINLSKSKFVLIITHDIKLTKFAKRVYQIDNGNLKMR